MAVTGSSVEGGVADGGGLVTVSSLITALKPKKYFKCWEIVGADGCTDHGVLPSQSLVNTVTVPTFAAETPMAGDPEQTAIRFNADSGFVSTVADAVANFTIGTTFAFFKLDRDASGIIHVQSTAATSQSQVLFGYLVGESLRLNIRNNGVSTALECSFTPSAIALDVWHMVAFRQPGTGVGLDVFFDGSFFGPASSEVVNVVNTGTLDDWYAQSVITLPADTVGLGIRSDGVQPIDGRLFAVVIDDTVISNANLTAIWDRALVNGLNA